MNSLAQHHLDLVQYYVVQLKERHSAVVADLVGSWFENVATADLLLTAFHIMKHLMNHEMSILQQHYVLCLKRKEMKKIKSTAVAIC